MTFMPDQFQGVRVPKLLTALERLDADDVFAQWKDKVDPLPTRMYGSNLEPPVEWNTTWIASPASHTYLPSDHPDLTIPNVILEKYLGGSAQGWVYAGRVESTGLVVAVKILRGGYVESGGRAAREAIVCARLRHRNILRVFHMKPAGGFWVILMEFVQGEDLSKTPVTSQNRRACFGQLADALWTLAQEKIVHRDLKPANIVLRQGDYSPVIVDFGFAVDLNTFDPELDADVCGTPLFMAPESFSGCRPEPSFDAYSLGVTAVDVLLDNSLPHHRDLSSLVSAKQSGAFQGEIEAALADAGMDLQFREWIKNLIAQEPSVRMAAVEAARTWVA